MRFLSAGPTPSGKNVQARFRIVLDGESHVRSWTMTPEQMVLHQASPKKATIAMVSWLFRTLPGVANPRDHAGECARALAALRDAATGRTAQQRAITRRRALAERAVRRSVLLAVQAGVPDDRIHEIVKESIVSHTMTS